MKKKINIDLTPFAKEVDDATIRKTFINDNNLMLIYCVLNNHNPITISELTKTYNKTFSTNFNKAWLFQELKKIEYFGLFIKKSYSDCINTKTKSEIDSQIIEKHKAWLMGCIPKHFSERFSKNKYYVLTPKGEEWVEFVSQQLKKIKGG